jgi:hypothetical protein
MKYVSGVYVFAFLIGGGKSTKKDILYLNEN